MLKIILSILIVAASSVSALAQNKEALCGILPAHGGSAGADYVAGVDVRGKSVVSADLGSSNFVDVVRIPVSIDLAKQLNQTVPVGTELTVPVGMIEIHQKGNVVFNGSDVTGEVYSLCGKLPIKREPKVQKEVRLAPASVMEPVLQAKELKEEIIWGEGY